MRVGLTQKEVSELLGVSHHSVWSWEAGKTSPSNEHLVELASRFEVSTDWLLGREVVEEELLEEAEGSLRDAVASLPREDIEQIRDFIAFVREQRRRKP